MNTFKILNAEADRARVMSDVLYARAQQLRSEGVMGQFEARDTTSYFGCMNESIRYRVAATTLTLLTIA